MLALKTASQLTWGELQYIENPMSAKRTVEANNGSSVNGEPIYYAKDYNLPDSFTRRMDPYSEIHKKLDDGQVFLVNSGTTNPLLTNLKITEQKTTQCTVAHGQNLMFMNAVDAMLRLVQVPHITGVVRQEPAEVNSDKPVEKKKTREKHQIVCEAKNSDGSAADEACKVFMVVLNKTKICVPVKQEKDITMDGFSREFEIDPGDELEIYVVPASRKDLKSEINANRNFNSALSENKVKKLTASKLETKSNGTTLHTVEYIRKEEPVLTLTRIKQTVNTTVGELTLNTQPDKKWYVLEPGGPDSNKGGGKRIPLGQYPLKQYSSRNYPAEYEVSNISGRSKIIFYEYEKSIGMMAGLCPGKSYSKDSGEYKVEDSADAKKEIYDALKYAERPEIILKSSIKEKLEFILNRIEETEITTLGELYEKDNPDKKWYTVESAGPDSENKEHNLRLKVGDYPLKAYKKQSGEYQYSIQLLDAGNRSPAIMAKSISFKKRDGTAMLYVGNGHTKDEQWGLHELQGGETAAKELFELLKTCPQSELKINNAASFTSSESQLKVSKGQLTFDIEGDERYRDADSPFFSRRPHWPGGVSGVTLGRGFDFGQQFDTKETLQEVGVTEPFLSWLADSEGLTGAEAKKYIKDMPENIKGRCITRKQQKDLFMTIISGYENRAKKVATKLKYEGMNSKLNWDTLSKEVKSVLVDMQYRGDLKEATMNKIGKLIETGGDGLKAFVATPSNMTGIVTALPPQNRCDARKQHLES